MQAQLWKIENQKSRETSILDCQEESLTRETHDIKHIDKK